MNSTRPPRSVHQSRRRRWLVRIGRSALLGFMVLSTFALLTAGMSDGQPEIESDSLAGVSVDVAGEVSGDTNTEVRFISNTGSRNPEKYDRDHWSAEIERAWRLQLQNASVDSAPPADWMTASRRLSLAMVGSGLSLEEIRQLQQLSEQERFQRHRDKLFQDTRFHDYWAERFTRFLVGADEGPFLVYRRRRFRAWLSEQIAANIRYDRLARELVTAKGLWTDRPEVNFYTVTFDSGDNGPDPVRMAARVTRAFLGVRIDCLQCHDDFLGNVSLGEPMWLSGGDETDTGTFRDGTQQDFHQLAAFFTAANTQGLRGLQDKVADYQYQYLHADEKQDVVPQVPFGRDWLPPERRESDARDRLARWMTHDENVAFARAAVTRVWTLLFGQPPAGRFDEDSGVGGVDDLRLDVPPSPLMMTLTRAFMRSGYDIRELIVLITDSPAFRVDSRADFEITQRHEHAAAVFPVVRLRAEQVAASITQAARVKTLDRDSSILLQLQQFGETNDFLKRYGDRGEDEFKNDSVTITQRLVMLNGELTRETIGYNHVLNTSAHVGMFAVDETAAVEALYLANLNRMPTSLESTHFVDRIQAADRRRQAIEDLVWVLVNSSEFAWNH